MIAENAYANLFGLQTNVSTSKSGDGGYDFLHPSGLKVDIKATRRAKGRLLVPERQKHEADVYVLALVNVEAEQAWFLGWAYRHVVLNSPTAEYHGSTFYVVRQSRLTPMSVLTAGSLTTLGT